MVVNDLATLRREYMGEPLDEEQVDRDPFRQFDKWMEQAIRAEVPDPNAMALATASAHAVPSARVVLLKGVNQGGFTFFTNYRSRKAHDLTENPVAELLFFWPELARQVRISGHVEKISEEESDAYWRTRPREAQIAAWASAQSEVVPNRGFLETQFEEVARRFEGKEIPRPPFWGGFRVFPVCFEFWQGRPFRFHDRIRYRREKEQWRIERLAP